MADLPILPESLRLDDDGRIDEDLSCLSCDYVLRGLLPSGQCPECGSPIARSLSRGWLQFCDLGWLARVRSGAGWVLLGILASLPMCACGRGTASVLVHVTMHCIPLAIVALGVWRLTCPEPGPVVAKYERARMYARWTCLAMVAADCVAPFVPTTPNPNLQVMQRAPFLLLWIVCLVACGRFGRELTRRLPDARLGLQTKLVIGGLVGLSCYVAVLKAVVPLVYAPAPGNMSWAIRVGTQSYAPIPLHSVVVLLPILATLLFNVWFLVLIGSFWRRLGEETERAQHRRQLLGDNRFQSP